NVRVGVPLSMPRDLTCLSCRDLHCGLWHLERRRLWPRSSGHQDAPWRSSLALIEAFRDLPPRQLADLEQRLIALSVRRGEVLVRQGDSADALYLAVSGRFAVDVDGRHVAEVGSGAPIGEVAFFADGRR